MTEIENQSEQLARRHDLDALRATAMLLGIALHASLAYMPMFWPVQDSNQSEWFRVFFAAVHGFRMPLFFLLSGFFTAMVWQKRGTLALVKQRSTRILVPCLLGLFTIVPLVEWVSSSAFKSGFQSDAAQRKQESSPGKDESRPGQVDDIWVAAVQADFTSVARFLDSGDLIDKQDPKFGMTPLSWAAMFGQQEMVEWLVERGADIGGENIDGGRPLHVASFFGQPTVVETLLSNGADRGQQNSKGETALDNAKVDMETTAFIVALLKVDINIDDVETGRVKVLELLSREAPTRVDPKPSQDTKSGANGVVVDLMNGIVFHHLWFLWFLCWLVPFFCIGMWLLDLVGLSAVLLRISFSPAWYLLAIPLTVVAQLFMWQTMTGFGPDTSAGWLPMPHVFAYYALFFGFGAFYFLSKDNAGRLGRWWIASLALSLLVLLPLGMECSMGTFGWIDSNRDNEWTRPVGMILQAVYAWTMTIGSVGLFRALLRKESRVVRYVSDSSYWLYLSHVPLVIGLQWMIRDWRAGALLKFALVCFAVTTILLLFYEWTVRYTWVGWILNGRRYRSKK